MKYKRGFILTNETKFSTFLLKNELNLLYPGTMIEQDTMIEQGIMSEQDIMSEQGSQ